MIETLLFTLIALTIVIAAVLVWLLLEHSKLKWALRALENFVCRNSKDIAGICSAAVQVDRRMLGTDELLKAILKKLAEYEDPGYDADNSSPPYHNAIQKIHNGATAEELVKECGVSQDEAMLLIHLHSREGNTKGTTAP